MHFWSVCIAQNISLKTLLKCPFAELTTASERGGLICDGTVVGQFPNGLWVTRDLKKKA